MPLLLLDFLSQLLVKVKELVNLAAHDFRVLANRVLISFFVEFFHDCAHIDLFGQHIYFLLKFRKSIIFLLQVHNIFLGPFAPAFEIHVTHELFDYLLYEITVLSTVILYDRLIIHSTFAKLYN